jgi:hypothetical protein
MPYHSIPTKTNDDDPETVSYSCDFGRLLLLDTASWQRFQNLKHVLDFDYLGHRHRLPGAINFQRIDHSGKEVGFAFQYTQVRTRLPPLEGIV